MKNKTKKILAGLALGVTGMAALTGCSGLTTEQQNQLNSALTKIDSLIDVMEEQKTNALTKEGVYAKLHFAKNQLLKFDLAKLKIFAKSTIYDNMFTIKETSEGESIISYFSNNIEKYVSVSSYDGSTSYAKKNYNNGKAYKYVDYKDSAKSDVYEEYNNFMRKSSEFADINESSKYGQFLAYYGRSYLAGSLEQIFSDLNIVSFNYEDNKIKLKIFNVLDGANRFDEVDITIENDLITSVCVNMYKVTEDRFNIMKDWSYFEIINSIYSSSIGDVVSREEGILVFDYSDFDTSAYDAKFAEIESSNAV